jgi:hypothetical protein
VWLDWTEKRSGPVEPGQGAAGRLGTWG